MINKCNSCNARVLLIVFHKTLASNLLEFNQDQCFQFNFGRQTHTLLLRLCLKMLFSIKCIVREELCDSGTSFSYASVG